MKPEEHQRARKLAGEVRLSLQDYHDLLSSATKADMKADQIEDVVYSVKKFMTFLRTRDDIDFNELMNAFNKEVPNLTMYIDDTGKVGFNLSLTRENS